ncbi:uncharacterized protein [Physcomitrium patens]|uniref:DUF493 domain-containing protein n=1 Tax=Physcomitrium patens TaxID=3218 RepID=A0A2K1JDQ2_PHYPA|nr:uncharacterized protein LOC112292239 [Physcomitrium patens]PNR39662.1 hypothetical protein PHYPA_019941 [Physcomitrium patens]|eukprot:XP_024396297.1 uncharacterized protein LOC112292239 [Physcomitrella patens]
MRSYTHPVHYGAAAALFSAAPLPSTQLRESLQGSASIVNCCSRVGDRLGILYRVGLGLRCGVSVKSRISVSPVLIARLRHRTRGSGCAGSVSGNYHQVREAVTMQRLLIVTQRRTPVDSKIGRPCLVCRSGASSSNNNEAEAGDDDFDKRTELEVSPPQDAVLKAISEISKAEGRVGKTTNMIIGGTVKEESLESELQWNAIDQKVNVYPMVRDFTAIGTGGDEFVQAMVEAVEAVTESPVPKVTKKMSAKGKYVSVKIGVTVTSSEQVKAVYDAMRKDVRMKYFL